MKEIQNKIEETLRSCVGLPNTEKTRQMIVDSITTYIPNVSKVNTNILWNTMTFKSKFMWWIANSVFPVFGKTVRNYRILANAYAPEDKIISEVPDWASEDPKTLIVSDMYLNLPKPVKYINVELKV